jgi:hypothetical protein
MDADKTHKAIPSLRAQLSEGTKEGCDFGMPITSSGAVGYFKNRIVQSLGWLVGLAGEADGCNRWRATTRPRFQSVADTPRQRQGDESVECLMNSASLV